MVVIPAYEAQGTIRSLVQEILALGLPVVVVDDASRDATSAQARAAGARVVRREVNGGKGAALRDGFLEAQKSGFDWIVTLDADGQHLAREIPQFFEACVDQKADLVLGNRMENPRRMPFERRLTNTLMSWLLSKVTDQQIPDSQCGFRLIRTGLFKQVTLTCDRFEVESELVVKAAWAGARIHSIPVTSVYRRHLSFIRPIRDTVRFLRFLWRLKRQRPR